MIDEEHLKRLKLSARPFGQRVFGSIFLLPNYNMPPATRIVLEGVGNIPRDRTVMFALNQGEVCTCPSRALIHESIYDDFMERALKRVAAIKQGIETLEEINEAGGVRGRRRQVSQSARVSP